MTTANDRSAQKHPKANDEAIRNGADARPPSARFQQSSPALQTCQHPCSFPPSQRHAGQATRTTLLSPRRRDVRELMSLLGLPELLWFVSDIGESTNPPPRPGLPCHPSGRSSCDAFRAFAGKLVPARTPTAPLASPSLPLLPTLVLLDLIPHAYQADKLHLIWS